MTAPFRWGVMGCARIAASSFIPAILASENGVLGAIASRDGPKAAAWAARFGCRAHAGYEALLADPAVDGVYIPLVTSLHAEWTLKAIEAGKHVLCDKPIALKAAEIDPLIAARDRTGLTVGEAFMVASHPQWAFVRDRLAEGRIGALKIVQGAFSYRLLDPENMRNRPELGGGALPDIGVYPIVTTRFVTGLEPRGAVARIERDPVFGIDRFVTATLDFDGFDLSFYLATQMAQRQVMTFHGETGWIEVRAPFNTGLYGHAEVEIADETRDRSEVFRFGGADHYRLIVEGFVRAVRGEGGLAVTLEGSRANQRAVDACFAAAGAGTRVAIG
jgi:predicted dehydrogenase